MRRFGNYVQMEQDQNQMLIGLLADAYQRLAAESASEGGPVELPRPPQGVYRPANPIVEPRTNDLL